MQDKEDVKRGMYDNEYFNVKSEQDRKEPGGLYDNEYVELKSEQKEIPLASGMEDQKDTEENAAPGHAQEHTKERGKKQAVCRTQAEVLAALILCIAAAIAGAAGYGSMSRKQAAGAGQASEDTANAKNALELQMPNLLHAGVEEARLQLAALGLEMQEEEEEHEDMAEGIVLSQEPAASVPVTEADTVRVVISKGSGLVAVPDLLNQEKEAAGALLAEAQLGCEVEEVFSDDVAAGLVVSQSAAKDEMLQKNTVVVISISKGPEVREQEEEKKDRGQTPAPAQANKPAAPAAPKEPPAPQPAAQETPQSDGGGAAPQPEQGGIQEENISDDWGGVGEEDLSGDW